MTDAFIDADSLETVETMTQLTPNKGVDNFEENFEINSDGSSMIGYIGVNLNDRGLF